MSRAIEVMLGKPYFTRRKVPRPSRPVPSQVLAAPPLASLPSQPSPLALALPRRSRRPGSFPRLRSGYWRATLDGTVSRAHESGDLRYSIGIIIPYRFMGPFGSRSPSRTKGWSGSAVMLVRARSRRSALHRPPRRTPAPARASRGPHAQSNHTTHTDGSAESSSG